MITKGFISSLIILLMSSCGFKPLSKKSTKIIDPTPVGFNIYNFYNYSSEIRITGSIDFSKDCTPDRTERYQTVYKLVAAKDTAQIFHETKGSSIYAQCKLTKPWPSFNVDIPKDVFYNITEDCSLIIELTDYKKQVFKLKSDSFSPSEVKHDIDPDTSQPFTKVNDKSASFSDRGTSINLELHHNIPGSHVFAHIYYQDRLCTAELSKSTKIGKHKYSLSFSSNTLEIPPGEQKLRYEVFIGRNTKEKKTLFSDTLTIVQPQLYWLSFENKNADLDVSNMDRIYGLFAKEHNGDPYYEIWNNYTTLFTSSYAKNNGAIPNQKGKIKVLLETETKITFKDKDVDIKDEMIGSFKVDLKNDGQQHLNLKDIKRVKNFDLYYTLTPVNSSNYRKEN